MRSRPDFQRIAIGVLIGLLAVLTALVVTGATAGLDTDILLSVHRNLPWWAVQTADVVSEVADVPVVLLASAAVALALARRHRLAALRLIATVWGASLATNILKQAVHRPRPKLWHTIVNETNWSYPSGHATASSALAAYLVLSLWNTRWRVAAIVTGGLLMLSVGVSRMVLGVHYGSDVLAGWTVGIVCAFVARHYITDKPVNRG